MNYLKPSILACALAALYATPAAYSQEPAAFAAENYGAAYPSLYDVEQGSLQKRLDAEIAARPDWARLVSNKKMAVALVDLTNMNAPRFASANGEQTLYAASMPKIAILLAVFQKLEDGEIADTPALRKDLVSMIRVSSNPAATRMIDVAGGLDAVNEVLKDPRYKLYDVEHGGGLWIGKRYAKIGRRIGDPLKGVSHAASATQVARFYYLLATGRLVSESASKSMLDILSNPGIQHKFVASLSQNVDGADIYRKSGTWRTFHADSILVQEEEDDGRHYILVGIVEAPTGGQILKNLVPAAERALRINNDH